MWSVCVCVHFTKSVCMCLLTVPQICFNFSAAFQYLIFLQDVFWSQQVKEADECTDPDTRKRKRPRKPVYDTSEVQELLQNYEEASHKVIKLWQYPS